MPTVYFLEGDRPLTKQYVLDSQGQIQKTPYPFVREVTSFEEQFTTLDELAQLLEAHGRKGHCLFKGQLVRPLRNESRAGLYHKDQGTWLIVLDFDGAMYNDVDEFMQSRSEFRDVSYIKQMSASSGIEGKPGLRCHAFALAEASVLPGLSKLWLTDINFTTPVLRAGLELTASGVALRFKLDVTTMQNDKLIYIAPPALGPGIQDPYPTNRIQLIQKPRATVTIPRVRAAEHIKTEQHKIINELRQTAGLEARKKYEYKEQGTVEYLRNPGAASITGQKSERGFVYFNLNGGDSWGYFHPADNPEFIFNFKGEPVYKTSELLPDYWRELHKATAECKPDEQGTIYLAFRELQTSKFRIGTYQDKELNLWPVDNERQLRQWMKENGRLVGELIPTWETYYDPTTEEVIFPTEQRINLFRASPLLSSQPAGTAGSSCPQRIQDLVGHVLGDAGMLYEHFINWLAGIIQFRQANGTAWLFQGVPGTGKGLTIQILTEILGPQNVALKRMDELGGDFTGWMEGKLLISIDEMHAESVAHDSRIMARIKSCITEPTISVRRMYTNHYVVKNHGNWIFSSNMPNPIEVMPNDRRFNVGNFQKQPYRTTPEDVKALFEEIPAFYAFLYHYKVDKQALRAPLDTPARRELIEKNRVGADLVGEAIVAGDLGFFWDQMPEKVVKSWEAPRISKYDERRSAYHDLVIRIMMELPSRLTRDELQTLFMGCTDNVPETTTKFTRFAHHHGVVMKRVWVGERTTAGVEIAWHYDQDWLARTRKWISDNVLDQKHLQAVNNVR